MWPCHWNHNGSEEQPIIGLLDGNGEYTLVYEDNVGDRLLAGDVPWEYAFLAQNLYSFVAIFGFKESQLRTRTSLSITSV